MELVPIFLIVPLVAMAALSVWGVVDSLRAEDSKTAWWWAALFVVDILLAFIFWAVG